MSDDEADPELLALLRQSLGLGPASSTAPPTTGVLKDAEYICDNSIDVAISPPGTKAAAETVWRCMQRRSFSTETWSEHELHPKAKDESTVNFIFTMNLLNFSFWSELSSENRFAVEYRDKRWTGYWSLIAALQRALDEGHPITTPSFWNDEVACPNSLIEYIFRSATDEPMPLLSERISILREAGLILDEYFEGKPLNLINEANQSAARLVNLLVEYFPNFQDVCEFHRKRVRLLKRAQIMVADIWACFNGQSYGTFHDLSTALTMFADYRIPQMLHSLGCLKYSPRLEMKIKHHEVIPHGSNLEIEIRGCSIWAVELLRREIVKKWPEADLEDEADSDLKTADNEVAEMMVDGGNKLDSNMEDSDDKTDIDKLDETQTGEEKTITDNHVDETATDNHEDKTTTDEHVNSTDKPLRQEINNPTSASTAIETTTSMKKPPRKIKVNAVLIDFFLYDTCKEKERETEEENARKKQATTQQESDGGRRSRFDINGVAQTVVEDEGLPHHRTRSIFY